MSTKRKTAGDSDGFGNKYMLLGGSGVGRLLLFYLP
jgi:hypothetical protein